MRTIEEHLTSDRLRGQIAALLIRQAVVACGADFAPAADRILDWAMRDGVASADLRFAVIERLMLRVSWDHGPGWVQLSELADAIVSWRRADPVRQVDLPAPHLRWKQLP